MTEWYRFLDRTSRYCSLTSPFMASYFCFQLCDFEAGKNSRGHAYEILKTRSPRVDARQNFARAWISCAAV